MAGALVSELNKLKKDELIDIIVNGKLPDKHRESAVLVDAVRKFSVAENLLDNEKGAEIEVRIADCDRSHCYRTSLQCEALTRELALYKSLNMHLEKRIGDLETIINFHKESRNKPARTSSVRGEQRGVGGDVVDQGNIPCSAVKTKEIQNARIVSVALPVSVNKTNVNNTLETEKSTQNQNKGIAEENLSFSAAARRSWLYTGRAAPETTVENITLHLNTKFPDQDIEVVALPVRDGANSVAFRIGVDCSLWDRLVDPQIWPKGILIKKFRFFREQRKEQGSQ